MPSVELGSRSACGSQSARLLQGLERSRSDLFRVDEPGAAVDVTLHLAGGVVSSLPAWAKSQCVEKVSVAMQKEGELRFGTIFSGADMGIEAARVFLKELRPAYFPDAVMKHKMGVEWVDWKRKWLMLASDPEVVIGDAGGFAEDSPSPI